MEMKPFSKQPLLYDHGIKKNKEMNCIQWALAPWVRCLCSQLGS